MISTWWNEALRRNRLLAVTAAVHLVLFLAFAAGALVDTATILGVSRWIKPMKFAISIAIFTGTMAWLLAYLEESRRAVAIVSRVMAVTMSAEMFLIGMQSLRGVRSHFNHDTPLDNAAFTAMGVFIILNTVAAAYAAWLFFRRPTRVSGAFLAGIRWGMVIFVLASLQGGLMVGHDSHTVGVHDGGPGLPIVNWSTGAVICASAIFLGCTRCKPFRSWAGS